MFRSGFISRGVWEWPYSGVIAPFLRFSTLFKECTDEARRLIFEGTLSYGEGMVELGVGGQIVQSASISGFGVGGGVDETGDAGSVRSPGAHGTGFQGRVEGTAGETPASEPDGRPAESEQFGVGGGIFCGLSLVRGDGDYITIFDDCGANRDFPSIESFVGGFESMPHHGDIAPGIHGKSCSAAWFTPASGTMIGF